MSTDIELAIGRLDELPGDMCWKEGWNKLRREQRNLRKEKNKGKGEYLADSEEEDEEMEKTRGKRVKRVKRVGISQWRR